MNAALLGVQAQRPFGRKCFGATKGDAKVQLFPKAAGVQIMSCARCLLLADFVLGMKLEPL